MRPSHRLSAIAATLVPAALLLTACDRTEPSRVEAPPAPGAAESAAGAGTGTEPDAGVVDFRLIGPNGAALVVPVMVDGEGPFDFVLDTGATLTCVDSSLARDLELPETRSVAYGTGVSGAGRMRLVHADTVRVGDAAAFDLTVCALDLSELQRLPGMDMDGLLGLNFLRNFRLTLDFGDQTMRLRALE